jgi:hypothetical protein
MSRPVPAGQPAVFPTTVAPKPGRTSASDRPEANGRPRPSVLSTGYPSQPPWHDSSTLGGEYYYNPQTDEVVLKDGRRFARPPGIAVRALLPAAWVDSSSYQYPDSPPTGYPSQPPWHNSRTFGGEYYYNPKTDEVVLKDGRRFSRPRHVPIPALLPAAWVDPHPDSSPVGSGPYTPRGSREQSYPRSVDSIAGSQMPGLTQRMDQTRLSPSPRAQSRRDRQSTSSGVLETSSQNELFADYKIRDRRFYKTGRVFLALWAEPAGGSSALLTSAERGVVLNHLGERVFSKVRRFVVIRESDGYCGAVPINTYGGQGVAKRGVKKSEHAIIYTGRTQPRVRTDEAPRREETGMQSIPIRVDPDNPTDQLDPMSRIHFGGITTIQHNIRVKPFGIVNSASMDDLQYQFRKVWGLYTDTPVERDGGSRGDRQGKDRGRNDDSEEEDDDDEEEEGEEEDDGNDDEDSIRDWR